MSQDELEACFEAGIKLGGIYHQYIGTPISESSRPTLEKAIEESTKNQRYVESVNCEINGISPNRFGYDELSGEMMDLEVEIVKESIKIKAVMEEEDGYPMMKIDEVERNND